MIFNNLRNMSEQQRTKGNQFDVEAGNIQNSMSELVKKEYKVPEVTGYKGLYDTLAKPTQDEEKRNKRKRLFSTIGDGVMALSNLFFASSGAPSTYNGDTTLSGKAKERWDRLMQEKKDNALAAVRMQRMQDDDTYRKLSFERDIDSGKYNLLQDRWSKILPFTTMQKELDEEAAKKEAEKEKAKSDARIAEANAIDDHKTANAIKVQKERNKGELSVAYVRRSHGSSQEFEFNGKKYSDKDAWESAVKAKAAQLGISLYENDENTTTTTKSSGRRSEQSVRTSKTTRLKDIGALAAEVEKFLNNGDEDYSEYEVKQ